MPTSTAIAEATRAFLVILSNRMQTAQECLREGGSKPSDGKLLSLGLTLKIFATAVDIYRACEDLQPQIGSLPGQSLGDTEIMNCMEGEQDSRSYFDCLAVGLSGQRSSPLTLQQLLATVINLGEAPNCELSLSILYAFAAVGLPIKVKPSAKSLSSGV